MQFIKIYLLSYFIFFLLDLFWIGVVARDFYQSQIGFLMSKEIRWGAAILFYSIYLLGLVFFAIVPALKSGLWAMALFNGAFLGLIAYATYDLTNLATLKGWPLKLVICDLIWGVFLSGVTSIVVFYISKFWKIGSG